MYEWESTGSAPDLSALLDFVPVDEIDTEAELYRLDERDRAYTALNQFGMLRYSKHIS